MRPRLPVSGTASARSATWWRDYVSDAAHGPLPALLLALTVATGLVDAVSILSMGRVFVANMTGNVVFIGFALAGAPGFSLAASLVALAGFLVGARFGGIVVHRFESNRGVLLRNVVAVELVLVASAAVLTAVASTPFGSGVRDATVALMAVGLGLQNAAARRLAVADITTTVLTMTLTGIAADMPSRDLKVALRRSLSVTAMLVGALVGALLILDVSVASAMCAASGVIASVLVGATVATRHDSPWRTGA